MISKRKPGTDPENFGLVDLDLEGGRAYGHWDQRNMRLDIDDNTRSSD
jgi:hypothetical protein